MVALGKPNFSTKKPVVGPTNLPSAQDPMKASEIGKFDYFLSVFYFILLLERSKYVSISLLKPFESTSLKSRVYEVTKQIALLVPNVDINP